MTHRQIRSRVERRLGRKLPSPVWNNLIDLGYVRDIQDEVTDIEDIVSFVQNQVGLYGPLYTHDATDCCETKAQRRTKAVNAMRNALSTCVATFARQDASVASFRRKYLPDGLIAVTDVGHWIKSRKNECTFRDALVVRIPKDIGIMRTPMGITTRLPVRVSAVTIEGLAKPVTLSYVTPHSRFVKHCRCGRDGVLRSLQAVAARLATRYCWSEAHATTFVLTGEAPPVAFEGLTIKPHAAGCFSRILITVDPTTTPRELYEFYKSHRPRFVNQAERGLGEKAYLLAAFVAQNAALTKDDWLLWNRLHPRYSYAAYQKFKKVARRAHGDVLDSFTTMPVDLTFDTIRQQGMPYIAPHPVRSAARRIRAKQKEMS
jgi:hypothetical protein